MISCYGVPQEYAADAPLVVYHGGMTAGRGIEELLACLDRPGMEAVEMVFMGYGPLGALVAEVAAHHPPRPPPRSGPTDGAGGVALRGRCRCHPHPALADHQAALPNKLFESMMAGVPALVSDFGPMHEVVLGGSAGSPG